MSQRTRFLILATIALAALAYWLHNDSVAKLGQDCGSVGSPNDDVEWPAEAHCDEALSGRRPIIAIAGIAAMVLGLAALTSHRDDRAGSAV